MLTATDREVGVSLEVLGLTIVEPGEALVPAAQLLAILREVQDESLCVEADSAACRVRGEALEFELPGIDPGQFPDFPTFPEGGHHEAAVRDLRDMVGRTTFAAATGFGRSFLMGVLWELEGSVIRLVATDSCRLALAERAVIARGDHDTRGRMPVVPTKAMRLIERILQSAAEETVEICLRPNEALFRVGRVVIYSRLIEGRFPDYRQVMPRKYTATVPLQVNSFQTVLRQASITTEKGARRVSLYFAQNKLTLRSQGEAVGRSCLELTVSFTGAPVEIDFNPHYLLSMLQVLPADAEITLELNDGDSPALFRHGAAFLYLVVPMVCPKTTEEAETTEEAK